MKNISFQIALFPKDNEHLNNPAELLASVANTIKTNGYSELENQNILPEEITKGSNDIPRLIASSRDKSIIFQSSKSKINLIYQTTDIDKPVEKERFSDLVKNVLIALQGHKFRRLGYISTYVIPTDNYKLYAQEVLSTNWQNNIDNFNMRLGYKKKFEGIELNINLSIASAVSNSETREKAVQIQSDVNTLEDQDASSLDHTPTQLLELLANDDLTLPYIQPLKEVTNELRD